MDRCSNDPSPYGGQNQSGPSTEARSCGSPPDSLPENHGAAPVMWLPWEYRSCHRTPIFAHPAIGITVHIEERETRGAESFPAAVPVLLLVNGVVSSALVRLIFPDLPYGHSWATISNVCISVG